ncbi:amidohydrolase [Sphingobacterium sp. SG20118]|uniref:amidohydrolase n=1 Tax=Sphingobacterium sp. SG20118 TaxID=3367156 RepID=UPI0037DFC08C
MLKLHNLKIILLFLVITSCKNAKNDADTLYYGGPILTMEDDNPQVEAIAIKDGKILFAGSKQNAKRFIGDNTNQIDLENKTLMPGFIDAHGHITSRAGMSQAVDLSPSPYGTVNNIPELQTTLKEYINKYQLDPTTPVMGNGYDDAIMEEHRHPTREELDAVSTTHPIIVIHASGHASVVNSAMLKLLQIPEDVKDPEGGHYRRDPKTKRLNGKLEENASFMALMKLTALLPKPPETAGLSQSLKDFLAAQDEWFSYGQTTICDGRNHGCGTYVAS